jgi:hypothetical protein
MNKATAMKILRAKLYERELEERAARASELGGEKKEIGWGSQIRSYVLHPYRMVKDLRTGVESGNPDAVLDGDLDNSSWLSYGSAKGRQGGYGLMLLDTFAVTFTFAIITACGHAAPSAGISRIGFSIQVGAFSEVRNAERLTARLQDKGIEAFYFKRENGLYAVRFGDFPRRDEARKTAKRLVSERVIGSYFIAAPQFAAKEPLPQHTGRPGPVVKTKRESDMGSIAARTAERFVGIPYRWGGDTVVDGMDCSGFARAVYNLCGVNIPRTSAEQLNRREIARNDG